MNTLTTITQHYIAALYFTDTGDSDQPPADTPLSAVARRSCEAACKTALAAVPPDLLPLVVANAEQFGQDLWLTRNGHGVGFWDRPEIWGDEAGQVFTAIADALGTSDAYMSDAGQLEVTP